MIVGAAAFVAGSGSVVSALEARAAWVAAGAFRKRSLRWWTALLRRTCTRSDPGATTGWPPSACAPPGHRRSCFRGGASPTGARRPRRDDRLAAVGVCPARPAAFVLQVGAELDVRLRAAAPLGADEVELARARGRRGDAGEQHGGEDGEGPHGGFNTVGREGSRAG